MTVYYDARNPADNALTSFSSLSDRALGPAIGALLMSAVFIAAVLSLGPLLSKVRLKDAGKLK